MTPERELVWQACILSIIWARAGRVVHFKGSRRRCTACRKIRHHSGELPGKCIICHRRDVVPDWRPGMSDPFITKKVIF